MSCIGKLFPSHTFATKPDVGKDRNSKDRTTVRTYIQGTNEEKDLGGFSLTKKDILNRMTGFFR